MPQQAQLRAASQVRMMQLTVVTVLLMLHAARAFSMSAAPKVFVAGATGRLGSRIVKQCVDASASVVAGARSSSMDKAKEMLPASVQLVQVRTC
jgi:FlaA1/EpsC-like NDP-sugar epimerase